jgi:glucose/mannose-6-phosphate isomerase
VTLGFPPGMDSLGMAEATAGLPEQVAEAAAEAAKVGGLPRREEVEHVVVLGMGGSGIAGDVVLAVAAPYMSVPVVVVKSYDPPAFVGPTTLAFAVSFSGDTEETVEAASEAVGQGARLVAVTGGGELARLAERARAPLVSVPRTIPQPRAALGALAVPLLVVLESVGLFPGATRWAELAVDQLRRRRDQLFGPASPAAALARRLERKIPLITSSRGIGAAAALRWKTQINENAKSPAFVALQPELCHNEVAGWGQLGDVTRQLVALVSLRHDAEHPQVVRRFAVVAELLGEAVAGVEEVVAEGEGDLAQLFDLALFGDVVSLHLAALSGVDPGPVPVLDEIKARLRVS